MPINLYGVLPFVKRGKYIMCLHIQKNFLGYLLKTLKTSVASRGGN